MPMTPKEMIRHLLKNGFQKTQGGKGSHQRLENPETKAVTFVPVHNKELGKGLESKILKEAKLK